MCLVEFTTLLEMHDWSKDELLGVCSLINDRNVGDPISRMQLLSLLGDDPDDSIDMLISNDIISEKIMLDVCCDDHILYDDEICDYCHGRNKREQRPYYNVCKKIKVPDNNPEGLRGCLIAKTPAIVSDICFSLGCSIFSLNENPLCDKDKWRIEKNYQFLGYRALYPFFDVDMERLRSNGRNDLLIKKRGMTSSYIVEYKVWKSVIHENYVDQCLNYFDHNSEVGFVFTVNATKKSIWEQYKDEQINKSDFFVKDKGIERICKYELNNIEILKSTHVCQISSKECDIYHFIYDLYSPFEGRGD